MKQCLYSDNTGMLQISYKGYMELVGKAKEYQRCQEIKERVLADLFCVVGKNRPIVSQESPLHQESGPEVEKRSVEPVLGEAVAGTLVTESEPVVSEAPKEATVAQPSVVEAEPQPEPQAEVEPEPAVSEVSEEATIAQPPVIESEPQPEPQASQEEKPAPMVAFVQNEIRQPTGEVPSIKKDVVEHFNKVDASGRLFNIFKQYYACLNDNCDGPVRVTIKDGICSIWNYDEWEEFAFVDIFEGHLRIGVGACHKEWLEPLDFCEVPLLLARRHNLVCVQTDDLNQTVLDALVIAFGEVGVVAKSA